MMSLPGGKFFVFRMAWPVAFSGDSPICALPFRNTTVPVGILIVAPALAVKMTFCPKRICVAEAAREICEFAGVTTRFADPLLA